MGPHRSPAARAVRLVALAALALAAAACSSGSAAHPPSTTSMSVPPTTPTTGPAVPVLAPAGDTAVGKQVDGISCDSNEQLAFHIHTHVAIYVDGSARAIPGGIGIGPPQQVQGTGADQFVAGGSCFAWLHTHDASGIVHIESPTQRTYTLGEFFDIWGQPLSASRVGPATGAVTAWVNGTPYTGNPASITLADLETVQLDVGSATPGFQAYTWPPGYGASSGATP